MAIMIFGGYFLHCFSDLKNFAHYDYVNPEKKISYQKKTQIFSHVKVWIESDTKDIMILLSWSYKLMCQILNGRQML